MKGGRNSIPCACMDLAELAHKDRIYPVMYCKMSLEGRLDLRRLKRAAEKTAEYVPEILYSVDEKRGRFIDRHLTVEHIFCTANDPSGSFPDWDLATDAQLRIFVSEESDTEDITVGMSHILADGSGFLQYLYLLSAIYNEEPLDRDLKNCRDIKGILKQVPFFPLQRHSGIKKRQTCKHSQAAKEGRDSGFWAKRQIKYGKTSHKSKRDIRRAFKSRRDSRGKYGRHCICCQIEREAFLRIYQKARVFNSSINDAIMTAYARVLMERLGKRAVTLPCPADLRRLFPAPKKLTIGNMTGRYREIPVLMAEGDSFDTTLRQVHKEMKRQREKLLCFQGIRLLRFAYNRLPVPWLVRAIRRSYEIYPVSYTNFGEIDSERLRFSGCTVKSCYMTGTYRKASDFQLSVSTFQDVCTLNCTLEGDARRKSEGEAILGEVKAELMQWAYGRCIKRKAAESVKQ